MNEEQFNAIAYSYRSWPSHDPKGVSERYQELVDYVESIIHPVKELTDEEIQKIIDNWDFGLDIAPKEHMFLLCRAILRKAQEK